VADDVTPTPSWFSKWWPSLVVGAVTAAAWFALAPWDWSTVDAAGHPRTGSTGDVWAALVGVALVAGLAVAAVVRRRPDAVLRAPLAGLAVFMVLYAWRASQARVSGTNLWPLGLIGVVIPIGLLGTFGGSWLALRTIKARDRQRDPGGDGPES
jgi:LPXTG-motif cell wall-anchored protein